MRGLCPCEIRIHVRFVGTVDIWTSSILGLSENIVQKRLFPF